MEIAIHAAMSTKAKATFAATDNPMNREAHAQAAFSDVARRTYHAIMHTMADIRNPTASPYPLAATRKSKINELNTRQTNRTDCKRFEAVTKRQKR